MAVAFVACNGDSGAGKSPEAAGGVSDFDDSLLYALGRQQGLLLNERLSESGLPSGGAVDKEAFMAGLRNALMSDFGAPGVMKGLDSTALPWPMRLPKRFSAIRCPPLFSHRPLPHTMPSWLVCRVWCLKR